jgi:hypothetical protein
VGLAQPLRRHGASRRAPGARSCSPAARRRRSDGVASRRP